MVPIRSCTVVSGLVLAVAAVVTANSVARTSAPQANLGDVVRSAADALQASPNTVGLTVGAVHRANRGVWGFGKVAPGTDASPDARTIYPVGSISKTFAGLLLAHAVVAGSASLDHDVRQYLEQPYPNLEYDRQPIPLFTLLNHRSGLPRFLPATTDMNPRPGEAAAAWTDRVNVLLANYSRAEFHRDLRLVRLESPPNTRFAYSNAAVQLLGFVLERISGLSISALLARDVSAPLGLTDTAITLTPEQQSRRVTGFEGGVPMPATTPDLQLAGSLYSTAADMLKYVEWQMEERDPAAQLSHRPTFTDSEYAAGLNWQMLRVGERRLIWQDGTLPGFTALCAFHPGRRLGIVVLSNSSDQHSAARLAAFANRVFEALDPDAVRLPVSRD